MSRTAHKAPAGLLYHILNRGVGRCRQFHRDSREPNPVLLCFSQEFYHRIQNGAANTDPPRGDGLPDSEEARLGCIVGLTDTYGVAGIRNNPSLAAYGDEEYAVMMAANGATGVSSKDWGKGGKQW